MALCREPVRGCGPVEQCVATFWAVEDDDRHRADPGARGTIDFERGRYRIDEGNRPVVVDGGGVYALEPDGRWNRPLPGSGPQPNSGQPLWVLQLLGGAVGASRGEDGALRVVADIVAADERSRHGVRMMPQLVLRDARRLPIDVWLEHGRVRRARLPHAGGHLTIDLEAFGGPPPIELPPEALLVEPDLRLPE